MNYIITKIKPYQIVLFLLFLFILFIGIYSYNKKQWLINEVKNHARVIRKDVWALEKEGPIDYLTLAANRDNYIKIVIDDLDENVFLVISGPETSSFDRFLERLSLLPVIIINQEINYNGSVIAYLKVYYQNKNIYVYFYVLFVFVLLYFILTLFIENNKARQLLEVRVETRTRELNDLKKYLFSIINSMPSVLIGVNENHIVTQWNRKAEDITGFTSDKAVGQNLFDVFPGIANKKERLAESIATDTISTELNVPREYNGQIYYENITIYPLPAGITRGAVIRIEDVTKEHKLQEELNHSRRMDAIGQLAGGIAHDFNNILAGIIGAAQVLRLFGREQDEKSLKFIDSIIDSVNKASALTGKLLAFGRKEKTGSTPIDIHSVVFNAIEIFKRTFDKKIKISINMAADNSTVLDANSAIENILLNLGINSSHAMPMGGEIFIETSNVILDDKFCSSSPFDLIPGLYVRLQFRDNGSGIPEGNLKKIFEPFYTTKKAGHGTGLGLASVYGNIQDLHGAIEVESRVGIGTAFIVFLPCTDEEESPVFPDEEILHGSGTVLLIDDEESIRNSVEAMLKVMGYDVLSASDGSEAIGIYRSRHSEIDIVLLDMIMPDINGAEAFALMKEINSRCNVVISSGYTRNIDPDELIKAGVAGFIKKPYKISELSRTIYHLLNKNSG